MPNEIQAYTILLWVMQMIFFKYYFPLTADIYLYIKQTQSRDVFSLTAESVRNTHTQKVTYNWYDNRNPCSSTVSFHLVFVPTSL